MENLNEFNDRNLFADNPLDPPVLELDVKQNQQNATGTYGGIDWISALLNFGAAVYSGVANKRSQERQFAYNDKAAERAYQQQLDLINRQNLYNSPANQMALLRQAGLNPLLGYGNLANAAQQSSGEPRVAERDYIGPAMKTIEIVRGLSGFLRDIQEFQMVQQQINRLRMLNDYQDVKNHYAPQMFDSQAGYLYGKVGLTNEQLSQLSESHDANVNYLIERMNNMRGLALQNDYAGKVAQYNYANDDHWYKLNLDKYKWWSLRQAYDLNEQYAQDERENRNFMNNMLRNIYSGNASLEDIGHFMLGQILQNVAPMILGGFHGLKMFNTTNFSRQVDSNILNQTTNNNNSTQTHQHVHQHTGSVSNVTHYEGDNRSNTTFKKNKWNRK